MSLLDEGRETVTVYLEETWVDSDGNLMVRPGPTGITTSAAVQVLAQSGTSARRSEQGNEGFETEEVYRLRFPRSFPHYLNSESRVEWLGKSFEIVGEARLYNGSERTAHIDYVMRRT